jgi:hypothetical protein
VTRPRAKHAFLPFEKSPEGRRRVAAELRTAQAADVVSRPRSNSLLAAGCSLLF